MRFLLIALFISTTLLAQTTRNVRYTDARWVCLPDTAAVAIEKGSINVSTGSK